VADKLLEKLTLKYGNVSYDDRDLGMGRKIKDSELIGIPWSIIIGKNYEENKQLEITNRSNGEKSFLTESEVESFKFEQYTP
jgi:prolyl-tRNA synthetase